MNPMPALEPMLKQLRLSGVLDSLEARNRQAIESKLAYTEFLALLIQDEVARRNQRQFNQRVRKSQICSDKTLERFDFDHNPGIDRAYIADLATCRFVAEKAPVSIVGPCGTGKSHLAQALGHCALRQGYEVLFITQAKLLAQMNAARAINAYDRKLQQLAKIALIVIDDFGLRPLRTPQDEDIHDLVAERYEQVSTVVTSNLCAEEWIAAFPNKVLGAATIDRLRDGVYQVVLDGETRRKPRPNPRDPVAARAQPGKTSKTINARAAA
jgi:DNA replication protein DnaC